MSNNFEITVTPAELDDLIYGITLVGLAGSMDAAVNHAAMTPEQQEEYAARDDALFAFYSRLAELRSTADL